MKYWKNKAIQNLNEADLRQALSECIDKVEQLVQEQQPKAVNWLQFVKDNKTMLNLNNIAIHTQVNKQNIFDWLNVGRPLNLDQQTKIINFFKSKFETV